MRLPISEGIHISGHLRRSLIKHKIPNFALYLCIMSGEPHAYIALGKNGTRLIVYVL